MTQNHRSNQGQIGRNAPCPCGSGRRYKHCHGTSGSAAMDKAAAIPAQDRIAREIPLMGATAEEMQALFAESQQNRETYHADLAGLTSYCLFIGYPRSGHSLVGALMDAHPEMIVAHELDVVKFIRAGFDREQLAYLLIENARRFAEIGRQWSGYDYQVPGQWQGRFRNLRVLGDKKGGQTSWELSQDPALLGKLRGLFDDRLKFVHVVRNPFDSIATSSLRVRIDLDRVIDSYRPLFRINAKIRAKLGPERVLDIWHDKLIDDPKGTLEGICRFFDLPSAPGYLDACASLVTDSPQKSRHRITWTPAAIGAVQSQIASYDFLSGYSFES